MKLGIYCCAGFKCGFEHCCCLGLEPHAGVKMNVTMFHTLLY
jgi:hypothetical protein